MKTGSYFVVVLLSGVCVVLTVALILIANTNQGLQLKLQAQQQALNQGILGQQAQQISAGIMQDLYNVAGKNYAIRQLLEKHGYRVSATQAQDSVTNAPEMKRDEVINTNNTEASKQ